MLLKLAVTNIYIKSNEEWYCQNDVLAIGAHLQYIWLIFGCTRSKEFFHKANNRKKHLRNFQHAVKILFGTVNVLNGKNMKIGFMLSVKTSVTTNTIKQVI